MRVVIVAHNVVRGDGQGRINLEIARYLLSIGHRVRLVAADVDAALVAAGAEVARVVAPRRPVLVRQLAFIRQADREIDRAAASGWSDAVIANGYTTRRKHDLNVSQYVHAAWNRSRGRHGTRNPLDWAYQQAFGFYNARQERVAYANAVKIVVPSRKTAGELQATGVPADKVTVVPNGVDLDEFHPADGRPDRRQLGLPADGRPLLLYAGDLRTNRKGLRYLLQAVARLPHVHLAVAGRSAGSAFVPLAGELGVADRVTFLGFRRDVADLMRACDLFVFPSRYDPYGMVVSEALACGLPVVTSAATGASELMTEGCGTVLDDPADVDRLTAAIGRWTADPAAARAAGPACRASMADHGWDVMAAEYARLLFDAVGGRPSAVGATRA